MQDYRFVDKDPVIDLVTTAIHDSGLRLEDIAAKAHVSRNTLTRWRYGDVRRPQNFTLYKVFYALCITVEYVYEATGQRVQARPEIRNLYKKPNKSKPRIVASNDHPQKRKVR